MDFESARKYLKSFVSYEEMPEFDYNKENFNLDRLRKFIGEFGVDYRNIKFVHVAGSKGKGTTCGLIASYLAAAGHKTGLFTSPFMFDERECFWVDGGNISREEFASLVSEFKDFASSNGCDLTYFEVVMVLVLKYFVGKNVEWAVLETGLGGRLDATNIVQPEVAVLTAVEMEHTDILGKTLGEILDEKLGIYKEGVPFLIGYQGKEVGDLIFEKMKGKAGVLNISDFADEISGFGLENPSGAMVRNGRVAFCALKILFKNVDKALFKRVFRDFKLPGRFDPRRIRGKDVVFDIAHTVSSVSNLVEALRRAFPDKKYIFLVSAMKGKDVSGILKIISGAAEKIIFTSSHEKRGYEGRELLDFYKKTAGGAEDYALEDASRAYAEALEKLSEGEVLVVTGSHFLVAKIFLDLGLA
ncbi:MAG: Mur ligase family protein [Candidatus Peregrinibacteria bacterium]